VSDHKLYYATIVKQVTVAVSARSAQHAKEMVLEQDAEHMYQGQWLWAEPVMLEIAEGQ